MGNKLIKSVTIVGTGGLGENLIHYLYPLLGNNLNIYVRNFEKHKDIIAKYPGIQFINKLKDIGNIDCLFSLVILSVPDSQINQVYKELQIYLNPNTIVVHCSGATSLTVFEHSLSDISKYNYGVFYPLNTFSINQYIDWASTPIFIEGNNLIAQNVILEFSKLFSQLIYLALSSERLIIHCAAVVSANFSNYLIRMADQLLQTTSLNIDYKVVLPLMNQTLNKLESITPKEAQTGPAQRNDQITIEKHLELLKSQPIEYKQIYSLLTHLILNNR